MGGVGGESAVTGKYKQKSECVVGQVFAALDALFVYFAMA